MSTAVLIVVLLVTPASVLMGVGAGAFITWRVMRGLKPLPSLGEVMQRPRVQEPQTNGEAEKRKLPVPRA